MKHNNKYYCSFQIEINNQKKIKLSIIDTNKKQTIILLPKKTQEYFPIPIEFGINDIIVCEENRNSISCIKEVFDKSDEYHFKTISFHQNEYEVLNEVIFSFFSDNIFPLKKCFTFCEKNKRLLGL